MCNTIGCPNFDNPPLCGDCTLIMEELEAENTRIKKELISAEVSKGALKEQYRFLQSEMNLKEARIEQHEGNEAGWMSAESGYKERQYNLKAEIAELRKVIQLLDGELKRDCNIRFIHPKYNSWTEWATDKAKESNDEL